MKPRLEPVEVAQGGELPPHLDEGHLDRVLGEVGVAQDPMRDEDAAVADLANQGAEGLLVALFARSTSVRSICSLLVDGVGWRRR